MLLVEVDRGSLSRYLVGNVLRLYASSAASIKILNDQLRHMLGESWGLFMMVGGTVAAAACVVRTHTAAIIVVVESLCRVEDLT